ncbi:MAG: sulfatase-like hydrolase/transferase [Phycisphaerae bacterium]|jgi:arylsulfatase A-like enzyme|nr:sulfatase-like hydrolase/transferase [Phycisphaerae bacterium]
MTNTRRSFLKQIGAAAAAITVGGSAFGKNPAIEENKPNFILIFIDDMGYGDIGCFGSKKNRTPHLDKMAAEGMRFTSFYVTSSVCTPSRSSLMTGCYPRRVNMHVNQRNLCVLFPGDPKGLNPNEITIAEVLKTQGYATKCIGKWHLGDQPEFLPTAQGFDSYFGIPYSNDMGGRKNSKGRPPLPLMVDEEVIEAPVKQDTLTKRYTEQAVEFIKANQNNPFFIYLPHAMVHLPLYASKDFRGKSKNGIYGDATEELDWSTGEILKTLKNLKLDDNTLVIFTSDNGSTGRNGGSNAPLRGRKGQTLEGGQRVPCVMRWPGKIPAGKTCDELTSTIDVLPTFAKLAGAKTPKDRIIDGRDIMDLMSGKKGSSSPHDAFYFYQMDQLQAVRSGKWKLELGLESRKRNWGKPEGKTTMKLFDLSCDIHEDKDVSGSNPDVVKRMLALAEKARVDLGDVDRPGKGQRPAAFVKKPIMQRLKE